MKKIKSIRESYSTLLTAFKSAGVKLTESQKSDIDQFVLALESKIEDTKEKTVRATKKVVEKQLGDEYKKVFESIMKHQAENAEMAAKIQNKLTEEKVTRELSESVDRYLDQYVKEALPEQTVIDYDRMHKLETVVESLRDTLLVNDDTVEAKTAEIKESYDKEAKGLSDKIESLKKDLDESMKRELTLKKQIDEAKAIRFLEKKTADLPLFEARQVKARLAGSSFEDAQKDFKKVLEAVQAEMKADALEEEKSIEEEISNILEAENCKDEESCDKTTKAPEAPAPEAEEAETEEKEDPNPLTESEKINSDLMKSWMSTFNGIKGI